jgi:rhamnose utilization protein RhaD (predicted bifunctional aldolase and dehydrogenase)/NAD(P)-dependent dehydrogenase (short-subunit alcohol dehydrogenase family)
MENSYDVEAAARTVQELSARASELLALRTYTARLLGREPALVVHGGGNTSVKAVATTLLGEAIDVIHVKGSGWDLATIEPEGHPAVRLEPLRRLRALGAMTDETMVNELRTNLLDASAPTPSVETLLHAFLPARFVDHSHADAILTLCDQGDDSERLCREVFGTALVWVPYVMPGFTLAKRCGDAYERASATGDVSVMVLEKHGLFTWGATARESYERTIAAVSRAEKAALERRRVISIPPLEAPAVPASDVVPRLRGVLAKLARDPFERGPIVRTRTTPSILSFLTRPDVEALVARGCATPDHVLRTKPTALLIPQLVPGPPGDAAAVSNQLESAVAAYGRAYDAYFEETSRARGVMRKKLDPWPRIVLLPGIGACGIGATAIEADVALDVYERTMNVMTTAADVGRYEPCSRADLFDVEYWSLEQAKIKPAASAPLARCVALVTGAASGIGLATTSRLLAAGAHVAMVDRDPSGLAAEALGKKHKGRVLYATADVLVEEQVAAAFARTVAAWGGVDVVVSNAGAAPEGLLETASGLGALRGSIELNCLSHAVVAGCAVSVMTRQGWGGCLVFNASKSAFNPGPGFGPYAVAKSALVALMRQYAVDLGPRGIRSNAVNADRIRTALFAGGVVQSRASARGLAVDEYFRANLLSREVKAEDVADAFIYLATARATTGCVVTVDGGNAAAFPR